MKPAWSISPWNGARIRAQGISFRRRSRVDLALVGINVTGRPARVVWEERVGRFSIEAGLRFLRPIGAEA